MGHLSCPICPHGFLADVRELQERVASVLSRSLSCPICNEELIGLPAFHTHLARHFPNQHEEAQGRYQIGNTSHHSSIQHNEFRNSNLTYISDTTQEVASNPNKVQNNNVSIFENEHNQKRTFNLTEHIHNKQTCDYSFTDPLQHVQEQILPNTLLMEQISPTFSPISSESNKFSSNNAHKDIIGMTVASPGVIPSIEKLEIRDESLMIDLSSTQDRFENSLHCCSTPMSILINNLSRTSSRCSVTAEDQRIHHESSLPQLDQQSCDQCGLVFSSDHFLQLHKDIIHHHSDCFEVSCKICNNKFQDLETYRNHVRENHTDRRYLCDECPKTFKMKGSLMVHRRMYHDGSPSTCQTCKKKFPSHTRMEFHERRYHGIGGKSIFKGKSPISSSVSCGIETRKCSEHLSEDSHSLQNAKLSLENLIEKTKQTSGELPGEKSQPSEKNINDYNQYFLDKLFEVNLSPQTHESKSPSQKDLSQNNDNNNGSKIENDKSEFNFHNEQENDIAEPDASKLKRSSERSINGSTDNSSIVINNENWTNQVKSILTGHSCDKTDQKNTTENIDIFASYPVEKRKININNNSQSALSINDQIRTTSATMSNEKLANNEKSFEKAYFSSSSTIYSNFYPSHPLIIGSTSLSKMSQTRLQSDMINPIQQMIGRTIRFPERGELIGKHPDFLNPACFRNSSNINLSGSLKKGMEEGPQSIPLIEVKHWECDICKKSFTTKYFLKKHKRLHTGETPYCCTDCGKTFTFQQSYHKHLLYHSDEKPHMCTYCGRAFKEMSTLHNHVRIHTGEKPFVCETCGKRFRQRVSYLVHLRIHTGEMPYTCSACNKSFRYKVSLRSHKCEKSKPNSDSPSKSDSPSQNFIVLPMRHSVESSNHATGPVTPQHFPNRNILPPPSNSALQTTDARQRSDSAAPTNNENENYALLVGGSTKPSYSGEPVMSKPRSTVIDMIPSVLSSTYHGEPMKKPTNSSQSPSIYPFNHSELPMPRTPSAGAAQDMTDTGFLSLPDILTLAPQDSDDGSDFDPEALFKRLFDKNL